MVVADIMRKAGIKPDSPLQQARDAIKDGLTNLKDYRGLTCNVSMGPTGEAIWQRQGMSVLTALNGKWSVLKQLGPSRPHRSRV